MRHSEFYQQHPRADHSVFDKWSRRDLNMIGQPMWQRLRDAEGDELALRELMYRTHGWGTLVNWIFAAHGRPNKF